MPDDLKDILLTPDDGWKQEDLLRYLNNELSEEERHELEKKMAGDAFENDALEGLEEIDDKQRIELIVDGINRDIRKQTAKKVNKWKRQNIKPQWWLYFSILILLIIIVLIYLYIHHQLHS